MLIPDPWKTFLLDSQRSKYFGLLRSKYSFWKFENILVRFHIKFTSEFISEIYQQFKSVNLNCQKTWSKQFLTCSKAKICFKFVFCSSLLERLDCFSKQDAKFFIPILQTNLQHECKNLEKLNATFQLCHKRTSCLWNV